MIVIDAHQHFWQFDPVRDVWMDETMQAIRRDFMPDDLQPHFLAHGVEGCVAIQADQSEAETAFLLDLADQYAFIKGVVGWVDILATDLTERLAHFSANSNFKGIRHIAQAESPNFLQQAEVVNGIKQLAQFDLTYDILVYPHQLPAAIQLAQQLPNQAFVLDHLAKPAISKGVDEKWKSDIAQLAACPNVYCKLSGIVTEATDWQWRIVDTAPFLDTIIEHFGIDRVLYGSDWPVCLLAATYPEQLAIVQDYFNSFSAVEQARVMGANAITFYQLNVS